MFHVEHSAVGRVYYPPLFHLVYPINQTSAFPLFALFHCLSYLALSVVPSLSAPVRLGACFSVFRGYVLSLACRAVVGVLRWVTALAFQ